MKPPVLNSSLFSTRGELDVESSYSDRVFNNSALRMGVVVEIYETDDPQNKSKIGPEYDVMAVEQSANGGINTTIYRNCIYLDTFGGVADYFQVKRRKPKDSKKVKSKGSFKDQEGHIVLLLCLDKNSEKAIIIGSAVNPNKKVTMTADKGVHLEGEYNGVNWSVNKDGALTVLFRGPTDDLGKPTNAFGGSEIKIEKDGSLELNDKKLANTEGYKLKEGAETAPTESTDKYEKLRLDKTNQTLELYSRKDMSLETEANLNVKAKIDLKAECVNAMIKASGSVNVTSTGLFDVKADGPVSLKGPMGRFNFDGPLQIQASITEIKSQLIMLGNGAAPAVTLNTIYVGSDSHGSPVVSNAVGPFSPSVYIAS